MTIRLLLDSNRRVNALAETCKRYGVIVRNLTEAIGGGGTRVRR